jgi:hypothetical protein
MLCQLSINFRAKNDMLKNLILLLAITASGCGDLQTNISSSTDTVNSGEIVNIKQTLDSACQSGLKERLGDFYSSVPGDFRDVNKDTEFINELKECPRGETVNFLNTLRDANKKNLEIKAKTSYLLIKLEFDAESNKKQLLSAYSSYRDESYSRFGSDYIIDMICDVVINHDADKTFLSKAFELETNGAMATMLYSTFVTEFEKNPEAFLQTLKEKPKAMREKTYGAMCICSSASELTEKLASIPAGSIANAPAKEMMQFIKQNKTCKAAY